MKLLPLAVCMFATILMAQEAIQPVSPPAANPGALKAYLSLSDAQLSQLRQLRVELRNAVAPLMAQIAPLQKQLREQINSGADAATIAQTASKLEPLKKQVNDANDSYRKQALAALAPDQTAKLTALEDAMKLQPAIHQAIAMGLIAGPAGFMNGPQGRMGGMLGRGAGARAGARGPSPMRRRPVNN